MSLIEKKKAKTEERILNVAEHHLRTKGFDATRMSDIAADAEIAAKTLFNYFQSKEGLILALVIRWLDQHELLFAEDVPSDLHDSSEILPSNSELRLDKLDEDRWLSEMAAAKTDILVSYRWHLQAGTRVLIENRQTRIERIRHLQADGQVTSAMSADLIYRVYEGIRDNILGHWLLADETGVDQLKAEMKNAMSIFFKGIDP